MTANCPPSKSRRSRGRLSTAPRASRRNDSSTAPIASAGDSSSATSPSVRYNGTRLRLLDEADLAARLEHRPLHLVQLRDLLFPCLLLELLDRDPLARHVAQNRLAVLHDHDRLAVEE